MKRIIIAAILVSVSFASFAQEMSRDNKDDEEKGFKKENLFTGGGLDLSFSNYGSVVGIEPQFGYSINKWLDVGVVLNFVYSSSFEYDQNGFIAYRYRQTDLGPGAFVRAYPIDFLFIQAQYENNFIHYKTIDEYNGNSGTLNTSAPSLLLGAGYCTGREGGSGEPFFYVSISADVLAKFYSPYVARDGGGNTIMLPIIRGGVQIPLFQNSPRKRHYN